MYLVVGFYLLQEKNVLPETLGNFDFEEFVHQMGAPIYRKDKRKFSQMLSAENSYSLDFFVTKLERKKDFVSVTI
jgi:hypothetical protein